MKSHELTGLRRAYDFTARRDTKLTKDTKF